MFNTIKKIVFRLYCSYLNNIPIERGKYRLGKIIHLIFGNAIYKFHGVLIELNPLAMIDRKLIVEGRHDEVVLEALNKTLCKGGIFLDIGANIGYFSLIAASLPSVKVFAFEPSGREIYRLYRNICLNDFTNITVIPYGISTKIGFLELNIAADHNPGMNSVLDLTRITTYSKSTSCYFTTLDSLLAESILRDVRLCKIDVEGYEMFVLKGLETMIHLMHEAVFVVEISQPYLLISGFQKNDIYDFFEKFDFKPKFGPQELPQYDEVFMRTL
ncbi:FkbM family methyltransferase [Trichocoleus sp. FACHB-591]|uniref:FkbM family methyltransferase n=1 Tax=Trichocoleus sp. FACHB-591 TaxID=2692872 RepID=UPI0016830C93|nr:FkbM family methyltransferase [Trichocoleus sp. FACHB-591]MBD2093923.1 FkbM family methyltransferase [Trichocoleus sp. FACHB-591]